MAREKGMGNLQREKSGRWTMRVGIKGQVFSRSTRTKDRDKAERILQRFLAPFGLGEHRLPLADVWLEYVRSPRRNDLAPATLESKRVVWMQFARWMEKNYLAVGSLADVTPEIVAEYLAGLRADLCASSYNGRICVLREIFRVLAGRAGLEEDPWEGVRLRVDDSHSRRELTMDEIHRLLAAAKRMQFHSTPAPSLYTSSNEWHTLFLVGIYTGLRLGDCCRLRWEDVNLAQGIIQIVPQKTKRHAHGRPVTIPIHPALGTALTEQFHSQSQPSPSTSFPTGPILPAVSAMYAQSRWRVSHTLGKIFKAANITTSVKIEGRRHKTPEATFHSLRHTFVSLAANAGVPLHVVQSIVGHESSAMTRHYYHENIAALKSAVDAIPAL